MNSFLHGSKTLILILSVGKRYAILKNTLLCSEFYINVTYISIKYCSDAFSNISPKIGKRFE